MTERSREAARHRTIAMELLDADAQNGGADVAHELAGAHALLAIAYELARLHVAGSLDVTTWQPPR